MTDFLMLEYYTPSHTGLNDWLGDNEISRDDYDYALFSECTWKGRGEVERLLKERLLFGCCSNETHFIPDFFGRSGVLGIAYHG